MYRFCFLISRDFSVLVYWTISNVAFLVVNIVHIFPTGSMFSPVSSENNIHMLKISIFIFSLV